MGNVGKQLSDGEALIVFDMWSAGHSRQEISDAVGVSASALFDRTREARGKGRLPHPSLAFLPDRRGQGGGPKAGNTVDPTPREIAQACSDIQRRWSVEEADRRRRGMVPDRHGGSAYRYSWAPEPARGTCRVERLDCRPRNW